MVFNEQSNTFCARYPLKIDGVPSTVISRSPNNFWIFTEEDRGRSRKNLRMYNIQMVGRYLVRVDPTDYRQSVRGNYQAMATDDDILLVSRGSRPVKLDMSVWIFSWICQLDMWQTFDQQTIKLMDVRFENFMPVFTNGDSLYAFHRNKIGQSDCSKIYEIDLSSSTEYPKKTEMACAGVEIPSGILKNKQSMILVHKSLVAINSNGNGGYNVWTMAVANLTWTKCTVAIDSENCTFTVHPSGVAYLCGRKTNTEECTFWTMDNLREELREGVWAYRRLDPADNSIQNAEKISWKAMIREAVNADPRKKATLREINCFVRKTFQMSATFTKECVRQKIQANVVRGIAGGTFRMTQGCGLKKPLRLV